MSKAVVVANSAPGTRGKRKTPAAASSVVNSLAPTPPRGGHLAASQPQNASASTKPTTGARASSAGPSTARKRPRAAALVSGGHAGASSAGTSTSQTKARKASVAAAAAAASPASPPPPKAAKKAKEKPEKRLARYIASPSTATSERIERAFQHRLYLIDKRLSGDPRSPSSCDFNVLGSTGNVYEVKLQQRPFCTCPDFPRSGLCKHILFVMLRVLKLDRYDPRVWQKALLTSELKELLEISATSDGVLASQSVRQRFQEIQRSSGKLDQGANGEGDAAPKTIQREITGDCPICYEAMDDGNGKAKEPVVFCRVCGNNVHSDCFQKWTRSKKTSGGQTTCIYCRALWADGVETTKKGTFSSAYVNLADVSEPHRSQPLGLEDLYPESHQWIRYGGRRGRRRYSSD